MAHKKWTCNTLKQQGINSFKYSLKRIYTKMSAMDISSFRKGITTASLAIDTLRNRQLQTILPGPAAVAERSPPSPQRFPIHTDDSPLQSTDSTLTRVTACSSNTHIYIILTRSLTFHVHYCLLHR